MRHIRPCGHSEETTSLHYRRHPERCYYCFYLVKHPRIGPTRAQDDSRRVNLVKACQAVAKRKKGLESNVEANVEANAKGLA